MSSCVFPRRPKGFSWHKSASHANKRKQSSHRVQFADRARGHHVIALAIWRPGAVPPARKALKIAQPKIDRRVGRQTLSSSVSRQAPRAHLAWQHMGSGASAPLPTSSRVSPVCTSSVSESAKWRSATPSGVSIEVRLTVVCRDSCLKDAQSTSALSLSFIPLESSVPQLNLNFLPNSSQYPYPIYLRYLFVVTLEVATEIAACRLSAHPTRAGGMGRDYLMLNQTSKIDVRRRNAADSRRPANIGRFDLLSFCLASRLTL